MQTENISGEQAIQSRPLLLRRPQSEWMNDRLGLDFRCLDHGFVRIIDYMGDDASVVQAARISYGQGTKSVSEDAALNEFLMRHHHNTPFEQVVLKLHIKLPIFVARQYVRHRTQSINEVSARYSELPGEFYIPETKNITTQSKVNRQGRSLEQLSEDYTMAVQDAISQHGIDSYALYQKLLGKFEYAGEEARLRDPIVDPDDAVGIARELARMVLPLNVYTEWYTTMNLHNMLHLLGLRLDKHAQYEIRVYAEMIYGIIEKWLPQTYASYQNVYQKGAHLTGRQLEVIRHYINVTAPGGIISDYKASNLVSMGFKTAAEEFGIGRREWDELTSILSTSK